MKDRIKIFKNDDYEKLEREVNEFLETLSLPITNIRFNTYVNSAGLTIDTAIIIYKKRQL